MTGFVFYDGPSSINGAPIVGIATMKSSNGKTGNMIQTFIVRADQHPLEALRTGADSAICGDCALRGSPDEPRLCYVDVGKSVSQVWSAWVRGAYPMATPAQARAAAAGRKVRMGAYGDPFAIRRSAWDWLDAADGWTGYTHQWRRANAQWLRAFAMASVDSLPELEMAQSLGWRTFRVRSAADHLAPREAPCPASKEAGQRKQCIDCMACDGADRRGKASMVIVAHGIMAKHFN